MNKIETCLFLSPRVIVQVIYTVLGVLNEATAYEILAKYREKIAGLEAVD